MKLNEIAQQEENINVAQIKLILHRMGLLKIASINQDLSVDINGSFDVPSDWKEMKFQLNRVSGTVDCYNSRLTSLYGVPRHVGGIFECSYTHITTLEHAPLYVGSEFICVHTSNLTSFHGIEKWIPNIKIGESIIVDQTHLLGLALIEGINSVTYVYHKNANEIQFDISHHDPFQFQEQLLEHGLTEQAQL